MLLRFIVVVFLAGCGDALPRTTLLASPSTAPAPLQSACQFTERKCTRCHTIGRVLAWEAHTREEWQPIVTRMRQMASSGITKEDASVVLDCLSQRDGTPATAASP